MVKFVPTALVHTQIKGQKPIFSSSNEKGWILQELHMVPDFLSLSSGEIGFCLILQASLKQHTRARARPLGAARTTDALSQIGLHQPSESSLWGHVTTMADVLLLSITHRLMSAPHMQTLCEENRSVKLTSDTHPYTLTDALFNGVTPEQTLPAHYAEAKPWFHLQKVLNTL